MKITSIKQQVKNPNRASIFIDSKYSFSLSLDELVVEKLKIGMEIDEVRYKKLKKISEDGKVKARSLEWVLNRPRSIREFKTYLMRKKIEPELIDSLIKDFTDRKYLDEKVFADWLVEMRRRNGKSERAIRAELGSKGINRDVIAEIENDGSDELLRLKALIAKKQNTSRYKADPTKLIAYLARQGFAYDDIKSALSAED